MTDPKTCGVMGNEKLGYTIQNDICCFSGFGKHLAHCEDKETARRLAACANFCQEFDTEFLESHQLKFTTTDDRYRAISRF